MCKKEISTTMIKHPMVLVTWYDAKDGQTGWHSVTDVQKEPLAVCHSMGWMVTHNETKTVIMADYSKYDAEQDGGRHIAIPTGWVKSIAYLDIRYTEKENA